MDITITMPQLGLTMTEGTVSTWLKKPGDTVKKDEVILAVSTDKVDMDVESTVDGVLKQIIVDEGQTVPVGAPLAYVDVAGDESPAPAARENAILAPVQEAVQDRFVASAGSNESEIDTATTEFNGRDEGRRASPRARRKARELGIDIATVKGSGADGRVVEDDLLKAIAERPTEAPGDAGSRRRQLIADKMVESINTIPAFSVTVEVNAEKLVALYEETREPIGRAAGTKLTYTDLLLKALGLSLAGNPDMNSTWENGAVRRRSTVNLSLAVTTDRGVVAPVLFDADRLPLQQLVTLRSETAVKARHNRLTLSDLEGGVGTLSNLGMYGVDHFEGIISPGQTFILATGKLRNRPWVDQSLVIRPTIFLTLSVDHRIVDGATAAVFLERVAEVIEHPYQILWNSEKG